MHKKNKRGRKTEFRQEFCRQAALLCELGATERDLAKFFDVNESTITRWKQQYEEFCTSIKEARLAADQQVVQALFKRATGYSCKDTHFSSWDGEVTATEYIKHYPPSEVACIFWLKNRQPEQWREKVDHTVANPDGKPMLDGLAVAIASELAKRNGK